jgi:hypothetical protein
MENHIDLDLIAEDSAKNLVGAISAANEMELVNDSQDLHELIKAGITQALEKLLVQLDKNQS